MIKMSLFLTRRADLTFAQFSDYWKNAHWPAVQTVPGVKQVTLRYAQQHRVAGVPEGMQAAPFDGYAEAWFETAEDAYTLIGSQGWADIVAKDDERFLDRSKTLFLFSEEKVNWRKGA